MSKTRTPVEKWEVECDCLYRDPRGGWVLAEVADDLYEALSGLLDEIRDCSDPRAFEEWFEPSVRALAKARGEGR